MNNKELAGLLREAAETYDELSIEFGTPNNTPNTLWGEEARKYRAAADELEAKLAEAETTIDRFVNGYQGACYACEYVGQKNEVLEERLAAAERDAGRWRRIVNTILKEKAPRGVLSKEWCVTVATDALKSDGESLEFKKYGE